MEIPGDVLCCQNRLVLLASSRWKPGVILLTPQGPGLFPAKNDLAADVNSAEAEKPHSRPLSEGGANTPRHVVFLQPPNILPPHSCPAQELSMAP